MESRKLYHKLRGCSLIHSLIAIADNHFCLLIELISVYLTQTPIIITIKGNLDNHRSFDGRKKILEDDQKIMNFCNRTRTWTIVFLST
jgi:hypothetical protein